jgi:hypothetical protein
MTDAELEQHITDLGRLILKAMADGDRAAAVAWSNARTAAIMARSPAQVARMEEERGLGPCQFTVMGEADRVAAGARS